MGTRSIVFLAAAMAMAQTSPVTTRLDKPGGPLYATISGNQKKVADSAEKAWVISDGRTIVFSNKDGAGGYENEGQSLYVYDTSTAASRKVMAEYYVIEEVREARTSAGKPVLIAVMTDSGMGAYHVAVIDPERGEVFCEDGAKIGSLQGDTMMLAYYGDDDWDALHDNQDVKPQKTQQFDLKELLAREVMTNQHT